jgi:hypothetical protein
MKKYLLKGERLTGPLESNEAQAQPSFISEWKIRKNKIISFQKVFAVFFGAETRILNPAWYHRVPKCLLQRKFLSAKLIQTCLWIGLLGVIKAKRELSSANLVHSLPVKLLSSRFKFCLTVL